MNKHRVIVCGSRDWKNRAALVAVLNNYWCGDRETVLVHGACAKGADAFASDWASRIGVPLEAYPANWKLGRGAGPARNRAMAALPNVELCIAFWDGISRGTLDMITEATCAGIPVRIVPLPKDAT